MLYFSGHKIKKIFIYILITVFIISSFFIPNKIKIQAQGPTYLSGLPITQPTTWTLANSPYVINSNTTIKIQSILTIEPGVVIKFTPNHWMAWYSGLLVDGSNGGQIIAQGTSQQPIVFTSLYDNDYDNLTGTGTDPQPGDWKGIVFNNDLSSLNNIIVRYAGSLYTSPGSLEFDNASQANINNSTIEYSQTGALMIENDGQPVLDNLIIQNNLGQSAMASAFYARNTAGPGELKNSLIQNNQGYYLMEIGGNSLFKFNNNSYQSNFSNRVRLRGDVNQDVTWTDIGLPYMISSFINVNSPNTLTIEPGVILKFDSYGYFYSRLLVKGNLQAIGTPSQPIVFTSLKDDSFGGDTNGDASATLPSPGDWGEIAFENSSGSRIENAIISYAGQVYTDFSGIFFATTYYNSIRLHNSQVDINNSVINYGYQYGIFQTKGSTFNLQNSQIKNHQTGIYVSHTAGALPVIKNNQFDDNTSYALVYDGGQEMLDARYNWWGDNYGPDTPDNPNPNGQKINGLVLYDPWIGKQNIPLDPVILIPGIIGSWPDLKGELKIDPFFKTYENLLDALRLVGYQDGVNLFQFPYGWWQSNTTTAVQLRDFIGQVKNITGKSKVDLVGHSMGGLVSRAYIQSDYYDNDVDQLIFLGTPQSGSTKAYLPWEGGDLGKGFEDYIIEKIFTMEAKARNFNNLFDYIRSRIISVQQLLPIFDYLKDKSTGILRQYPNNYPQNIFLEILNGSDGLNKLKSRVQITNIVSDMGPDSTVNIIRVVPYTGTDGKWEHDYPEGYNALFGDYGLEYGPGDETVPFQSATALDNVPYTLCQSVHRPMPTNCQQLVAQTLTGQSPTQFINKDRLNGLKRILRYFIFIPFSPINIQIVDNQGRIVGQDLQSGEEINEVPGAFVGKVGEKKMIFIPNPQAGGHEINIVGIDGGGDYEIRVFNGDENDSYETQVAGTIGLGETKSYRFNYDENLTEPPVIKEGEPEIEEIKISDIIQHIEDYLTGFSSRNDVIMLARKLISMEKWYQGMENASNRYEWRKYARLVYRSLVYIKEDLAEWLNQGKINQEVYNILINDLNFLIQQF